MVGRVQIQADDVPHLFDEERIGTKLERLAAMGLQGEGLKDPVHGRFGDPVHFGRLADTPVRAGGLVFSVRRSSAATFSSDSERGRPGRSSSRGPEYGARRTAAATCPRWPWTSATARRSRSWTCLPPTTAPGGHAILARGEECAKQQTHSAPAAPPLSVPEWLWGVPWTCPSLPIKPNLLQVICGTAH
jgi:hypothetical protein